MDLSIIIVNWKSSSFCADCLTSIYASEPGIDFEIVVIDNASFDGCEHMLTQRFPEVHVLQSKTNTGFAAANNLAFSHSSGVNVCFLNPDTIIHGAALQTLYDALNGIPGAGAVGAVLFNGDGSLQTSCALPFPTVLNQMFDFEWVQKIFPCTGLFGSAYVFSKTKEPKIVQAVSGACIMLSRKTFLEVGMFSSEYFMYAEDIDLCTKVRMAGQKVYLINSAEIVHFGGGSSNKQKDRLFSAIIMRESNYRLLCKFRGKGYALLYRLSLGGMGLLRIAVLLLCLVPAMTIGRVRNIADSALRWFHLSMWAFGIRQVPHTFTTGSN